MVAACTMYLHFSRCGFSSHEAPVTGCSCGLYGLKNVQELLATWNNGHEREKQDTVFGAVHLWGRLIEHQNGWRAQFAYPAFLCTQSGFSARALQKAYGVEVFTGTFEEFVTSILDTKGADLK
jgi:hypothetical protein